MGRSAPSKPKLESKMEDAGNGTNMVIATRGMIVSFAGTTPRSMDPQKDEENLAPAAQTDVDHLPHQKGKTEDVPENLDAGEKDQVNDEAPLPDPEKEKEKESLEVHQVGAFVLRRHPNEGGLEEALEGFPVVDPDLRRQGGAQRPPTHRQKGLQVQETSFPLEPLLPARKDDQVAGTTLLENAPEEKSVISGTRRLAQYGQTRAKHADTVQNVHFAIETPRMAQQPSKRRDVRDNGNREESLENSDPDHSLRLCPRTSPGPMELLPLPKRKKSATARPKAKQGPEAREFKVSALRSCLVPWQPSLA
jgi:hypothetical protein